MAAVQKTIDAVAALEKYEHGFTSDIDTEYAPRGLNADIVRFISEKKGEPEWMLEWRLAAYERWLAMEEPTWAAVRYEPVDYQDLFYYAAPKKKEGPKSLDEVDPELLEEFGSLPVFVARLAPRADRPSWPAQRAARDAYLAGVESLMAATPALIKAYLRLGGFVGARFDRDEIGVALGFWEHRDDQF